MKGWMLVLCMWCIQLPVRALADSVDTSGIDTTSFAYANVMYEKGDFKKAANTYAALIERDGKSATLYYNLGNCYYRLEMTGPAILAYERALLLEPSNHDATYNLELANRRTRDEINSKPASLFRIGWQNFTTATHARAWGILAIIFFWLAFAGWAIYLLPKFRAWQRIGFFSAITGLLLGIICLSAALGRNAYDAGNSFGIVMSPSAIIKSEPSETSTNLALIHEGFKLAIIKTATDWTEVSMPDGTKGWIRGSDFERIDPFTPEKY